MAKQIRVMLEIGPKGKKVVAVAPDWPGLERGAKTGEAALERLVSYIPRYKAVTRLAGMEAAFGAHPGVEVVGKYPGTPSTDFWGISFASSSIDKEAMSPKELERELALMRACWAFFDEVRPRVSAELRPGPRGGGRDRDRLIRHVLGVEQDWGRMLGMPAPENPMLAEKALKAWRDTYCDAIRDYHSQGKPAGKMAKWPLRYLIRHTAYHTLDHAWEMEDRDLTVKPA